MFVVYILYSWMSKIVPKKCIIFREQGQTEFRKLDTADTVLNLPEEFFYFFHKLSFLKFVKFGPLQFVAHILHFCLVRMSFLPIDL